MNERAASYIRLSIQMAKEARTATAENPELRERMDDLIQELQSVANDLMEPHALCGALKSGVNKRKAA